MKPQTLDYQTDSPAFWRLKRWRIDTLNIQIMLYIPCPHCGLRNETEFHYGAESGVAYPEPNTLTDSEWAHYLHIRANPKGWLAERWVHFAGCGHWCNLWCNTITHEIKPVNILSIFAKLHYLWPKY
jgi:sarcosine oxidase, subunit delta